MTSFHRCKSCLTKTYCSKDCLVKDWEERHKELCKVGREEWKVKRGTEGRVETGLKHIEGGLQRAMMSGLNPWVLQNFVEVKEMCEKMGSADKAEKDVKHKKVKGDSKERRKTQEEHCGEVKLVKPNLSPSQCQECQKDWDMAALHSLEGDPLALQVLCNILRKQLGACVLSP